MIVADADDGMEYPMMTLDRGSDPGYRGLLARMKSDITGFLDKLEIMKLIELT